MRLQVSRNLQKQAELVTTTATSTAVSTAPITTIIKPKPAPVVSTVTPVAATPETAPSKEEAHVNGIEESKDETPEGLAARGIPAPVKETASGVPTKSNGNHEVVVVNKVYKSSPLLNGLLDRGTPNAKTAVNGENTDDSKRINGDGATIIDVRKRKLTFSSEDSNSQEEHSVSSNRDDD